MKAKRTVSLFIVVISIFSLCFSGCGTETKTESIPQCDIPMQTVTQSFLADNSTRITFKIPSTWQAESCHDYFIRAYEGNSLPSSPNENRFAESFPYAVEITNYNYLDGYLSSELTDRIKKVYKDLINGNPENYQKYLNESIGSTIIFLEYQKQQEGSLGSPNSVMDIWSMLADESIDDNTNSRDVNYLTEFSCTYVDGDFDTIAVVKYAFEYDGRIYKGIYCILKSVPYMVWGCFDDSLELSSGDIALQVANSLVVESK